MEISEPQQNHLISIMLGIILCEGRKKCQIRSTQGRQYRDLSCITWFLKESPWSANRAQRRRMKFLQERIQRAQAKRGDGRSINFLDH